ncbi:MAG TPA: hypothetical protein VLS92_07765 [Acidimicrobiia bacterium]|nr:hypothetical protein [Acidimicrobiia bacterium]
MRRFALLAGLCLLAAACGDESTFVTATTAAATSTTTLATTSSTSAPTTVPTTSTSTVPETTTTTWATFIVPAVDLCVIDHLSDDALNVRTGPGGTFAVIGTLPYDATGVPATGVAAADTEGRTWKEIDHAGGLGWVAGWLVTADACTVAAPAEYCIIEPECSLERLEVLSGPGAGYARLGTLPFTAAVAGTGASTIGADGFDWRQIRFRGEVGWVPAASLLDPAGCLGRMCLAAITPPSATCIDGWWGNNLQYAALVEGLEMIGVGGPWSEIDPDAFVIEQVRIFDGPEDANIVSPRPEVERIYFVGYAETDASFRGRWLIRRTSFGLTLAAVAPYDSTGFGSGVWETCVDTCQAGRPVAGEWCDPACVEDYIFRSCEGIAPGTWVPGDCAGPPPEVLGCLEP